MQQTGILVLVEMPKQRPAIVIKTMGWVGQHDLRKAARERHPVFRCGVSADEGLRSLTPEINGRLMTCLCRGECAP